MDQIQHTITIYNPVEASCGSALAHIIKPVISWKSAYYQQGMWKKERKEFMKTCLTKGKGGVYYFWAGLVDKILEHCHKEGITVIVDDRSREFIDFFEPELPGITFRKDQDGLINAWLDKPRGILVSFTGSGKTVLGFGCLSSLPDGCKTLWMCHKKDLMNQAFDEGQRFGFKSIGRVGDGFAEHGRDITIATRQSFKKLADEFGHLYDCVVVDEVHHVATRDGEYAYLLARVPAPLRLGLTATLPREGEPYLTAVGLIGPILHELTINEGNELGILAKPKIKIVKLEKDYNVNSLRQYSEVVSCAVTNNRIRNNKIAEIAKKHVEKGETVLIMITIIEHGNNVLTALQEAGVEAEFIHGGTDTESRNKSKHDLLNSRIKCVIASGIWQEGVNIPSLNVVIMAAGGKAEIGVLQSVGRGLRKTKDKDEVYIYDFFDPSHRFLIEHFGERLCLYIDNGWI